MTKEEIWDIECSKDCSYTDSALLAMDIFSKQQTVSFTHWLNSSGWFLLPDSKEVYTNEETRDLKDIEGLVELFTDNNKIK